MALRKLARHARESWEVPRDLLLRRYPAFVSGGDLPRGHVPVFVFHSLEQETFSRKLAYLTDNGYATLSADEHLTVLRGERAAPERAVVLTFDDGRRSLFDVGLPLMRERGTKGVVFLIPGRTPQTRPGEEQGEGLLSWDEVGVLSASGLFDIQNHTLTHARIHTAPAVTGFMTSERRRGYAALDVPLIESGGEDLLAPDVALGTPLLRSEPRTSEALRFHESPVLREACVQAVAKGGGESFFTERGWERRLRRLIGGKPIEGRLETAADREKAIRRELAEARRLIEMHTGRPAVHLCYPWHVSGPTARRLALETGHLTAYCGKVRGVPITLPGGDPQAIARIGEDYLDLLPGRGRADLGAVLRRKWSRRLRGK